MEALLSSYSFKNFDFLMIMLWNKFGLFGINKHLKHSVTKFSRAACAFQDSSIIRAFVNFIVVHSATTIRRFKLDIDCAFFRIDSFQFFFFLFSGHIFGSNGTNGENRMKIYQWLYYMSTCQYLLQTYMIYDRVFVLS